MNLRRALTTTLAIGAAGAAFTAQNAAAAGTAINWVAMDFSAGSYTGGGTYSNMTLSSAYAPSGHSVKVAARKSNGVMYGGWYAGTGNVCVSYVSNTLQPLAGNNYSSTFKIYGYVGYNGYYC